MTTTKTLEKLTSNATSLGNFVSGSPEWHELRNQPGVISGSEIGAILGLSPFTSPYTLWAQKTGLLTPDPVGNVAMRLGQLVEPAIYQLFTEQHPEYEVFQVGTYAHKDYSWAHANPDGLGVDNKGEAFILEIKHTATFWDSVPEHYRTQVLWYMWVFDIKRAIFAVVNAGRYKEYEVLFDEFEFAAILDKITRFKKLIETKTAPDWDGSDSTFETVRALSPDIEDTKTELGELGLSLISAVNKVKQAETELTELKSRVLSALNGSKYGTLEDVVIVTLSQRGAGKPYLTIKEK